MPQLWVLAGPNGAGKSTLADKYLAGRLLIVNPDVIARELRPIAPHVMHLRVQVGRETIRRQEGLRAQGVDFAIETTLSGNRELVLMRHAQEVGYKVNLVYVGIDTPALTIVDRAFVLDNTGMRYRLLLSMEGGQVKRLSRNLPPWARAVLPPELLQS